MTGVQGPAEAVDEFVVFLLAHAPPLARVTDLQVAEIGSNGDREFRILASQVVIDMFLDEESQNLAMLSDFIGKTVSLQVESQYTQDQFDIVLM